jgi:hypothetical protein
MKGEGEGVAELNAEKRLRDLALLCEISHNLHELSTKGQHNLIYDMFGLVRPFEMKLKLFRKQLQNVNLFNFTSCDLDHKNASVTVPFPDVRAVEMHDALANNFKKRFNEFHSHSTNLRVFDDSICIDDSVASETAT